MKSAALTVARVPAASGLSPAAAWALCGLAAAGAWMALRSWTPVDDPAGGVCALRSIAHVGCATCGLSRALAALAAGRLGASLALHPMALVLAIELATAWGWWGARLARGRPGWDQRWIPWAVAANAAAFLLVWVVRLLTGTIPV
jgi:hypothetical protein